MIFRKNYGKMVIMTPLSHRGLMTLQLLMKRANMLNLQAQLIGVKYKERLKGQLFN
jgi:hypothetical protein